MDKRSVRYAAESAGDAAAEVSRIADVARDALNSGVKRARRAAESANEWASEAASSVSDVSVRGYRTAEDAIRVQPILAVGVALLIGVALGALLFSRDD